MDCSYVMSVANYILEGHNITDTAEHFGKSRKYIYNALNLITDNLLKEKIALTLEKLKLQARKKAGETSKRKEVLTDKEVIEIINQILTNNLPLRTLAKMYNCSHTTIANTVKRVADDKTLKEIQEIYKTPKNGVNLWIR